MILIVGAPRIVETSALLPFCLVAKCCPPVKEGETKVTIDLNKKPLLLNELFPGMSGLNDILNILLRII